MPPSTAPKTNILRRFRRNRRGSAAVEFALVAPIFFAVLFAIIELALVFFASQILETVTQDTARLIMTGQAQDGAFTEAQFKDAVCAKLTVMFDCVNGVSIDVRSYQSFAARRHFRHRSIVRRPSSTIRNIVPERTAMWSWCGCSIHGRCSSPGSASISRTCASGKRLLTATAAFKNEPFTIPGATCS